MRLLGPRPGTLSTLPRSARSGPLRQATVARALPPGVLHQGAAFERLEQGPAGVTLHFAGGRPPATARLVVGADGGQSRVRQQVLGDGPPLYSGALSGHTPGRLECTP